MPGLCGNQADDVLRVLDEEGCLKAQVFDDDPQGTDIRSPWYSPNRKFDPHPEGGPWYFESWGQIVKYARRILDVWCEGPVDIPTPEKPDSPMQVLPAKLAGQLGRLAERKCSDAEFLEVADRWARGEATEPEPPQKPVEVENSPKLHWTLRGLDALQAVAPGTAGFVRFFSPRMAITEKGRATLDRRHLSLPATDVRQSLEGNIFRRRGSFWEVRFEGSPKDPCPIQDTVGMVYIWRVLQQEPGKKVASYDVTRRVAEPSPSRDTEGRNYDEDDSTRPSKRADDQDAILDRKALESYGKEMRRLKAKREKLTTGEQRGNPEAQMQVKEIDEHLEFYRKEIRSAVGFGGRLRQLGPSDKKRAADAVKKGLERAYAELRDGDLPTLAEWLTRSIHTGLDISYHPTPPIDWDLF